MLVLQVTRASAICGYFEGLKAQITVFPLQVGGPVVSAAYAVYAFVSSAGRSLR
jgi:hypothetical protein